MDTTTTTDSGVRITYGERHAVPVITRLQRLDDGRLLAGHAWLIFDAEGRLEARTNSPIEWDFIDGERRADGC
jgi:hypothetical protein